MRLTSLKESRVFNLSPEIIREFERVSRSLTIQNPKDQLHLPSGPIDVVLDLNRSDSGIVFDSGTERYRITINSLDRDKIYSLLVHEYVHKIDPSSIYYGEAGNHGKEYWAHPAEFNALSNEIIHTILRRLRDLRSASDDHAALFLHQLNDILKYPKRYGRWDFLPGGNIPLIIDWWEDNPELWRRFKVRLYNAIQDELQIDRSEEDLSFDDFAALMGNEDWDDDNLG